VRAAIVSEIGRLPEPGEVPDPQPGEGEEVVEVLAAPLNPIDINVAAGRFYGGHPATPYVPGCEGVGRVAGTDGFVWMHGGGLGVKRDGCLAERVAAPADGVIPVPEGADPALAGALGIAGVAGWIPLAWRAPVRKDDIVLVLGATGTVGLVAVQAARLLGAARIVAAGRNEEALARTKDAGADAVVRIDGEGDLARRFREACGGRGPTYVVDPLWGAPLAAALDAAATGARAVNIGQSAGAETTLASSWVRSKQVEIYGYSNYAVPPEVLRREYARLVQAALSAELVVEVERVPLAEVGDAWRRQSEGAGRKLVVVIENPE
jgi:NADPH2:quinone reductase